MMVDKVMDKKRTSNKRQRRPTTDPLYNASVEKALLILEAFGRNGRALNVGEIARATGITNSSAQRCVHTLERMGYMQRGGPLKPWVLAPRALSIAHAYLTGHPLIEQATKHCVDLNLACGESVSICEPDGTSMVYIARFPSQKPFIIHFPVGRRLPIYCTASGRVYLSMLPRAAATSIVRRSNLQALTPMTLIAKDKIMQRIDEARILGYAWSEEECYRGDLSLSAPILAKDGRPIGAINVSGPTSRWTMETFREKLANLLMETARAASTGVAAI
jgi:DNA-binding IclR family transcriptional regulator